jgi:hypothetical protein
MCAEAEEQRRKQGTKQSFYHHSGYYFNVSGANLDKKNEKDAIIYKKFRNFVA